MARQCDAARHPAGKIRWLEPRRATQPDGVQLHQHQVTQHRQRQSRVLTQRECNIVEHGQIGKERTELKEQSNSPPQSEQRFAVARIDVLAVKSDRASQRCQHAADQPQQRRLPHPEPPMIAMTLPRGNDIVMSCRTMRRRS